MSRATVASERRKPGSGTFGPAIDFQRLHQTRAAREIRRLLYRMAAGRDGWPLVFRAPQPGQDLHRGTSNNLDVHLRFCGQICPHCPYNKVLYRRDKCEAYGAALRTEIGYYLAQSDVPPFETLYFVGGTPSLTPQLVESTIAEIRPRLTSSAEIGVEIHPADATPSLLERLRSAGVNRISLGIETFRPGLLTLLGRQYTPTQAEDAIRSARATGFDMVDANLLIGIPGQEETDSAEDVRRCLDRGVDQISGCTLLSFSHTRLGRRVAAWQFPLYGERGRWRSQRAVSRACREGGLARSSVWSFTRPGFSPYSTVTHDNYVGFGAGAGSKVAGQFWFNTFSVGAYTQLTNHRPALVMQRSEAFCRIHSLYWQIYKLDIRAGAYGALFHRDLQEDFGGLLQTLYLLGLARQDAGGWTAAAGPSPRRARSACIASSPFPRWPELMSSGPGASRSPGPSKWSSPEAVGSQSTF